MDSLPISNTDDVRLDANRRRRTFLHKVLTRLGSALLVMWLAVTLTFVALQIIPGDPVTIILGPGSQPTPPVIAALRLQFGLDQSIGVRYLRYIWGLLQGDMGLSYRSKQPVGGLIANQIGSSIILTLSALALAWILAVVSVVLTTGRHRGLNETGRAVEVTLASLPDFWVGLILVTVFAFTLHWFPSAGGSSFRALVLPALTLAIPLAGWLAQIMRQSFEDALQQPFVLSSRARGAGAWRVKLRHALPHAVLPALALSSWAIGWLIGGSVAIEQIFARKGLGTLILTSVMQRDYPVIMGSVLLIAAVYVVVNLTTDLITSAVDRRQRTDY